MKAVKKVNKNHPTLKKNILKNVGPYNKNIQSHLSVLILRKSHI